MKRRRTSAMRTCDLRYSQQRRVLFPYFRVEQIKAEHFFYGRKDCLLYGDLDGLQRGALG